MCAARRVLVAAAGFALVCAIAAPGTDRTDRRATALAPRSAWGECDPPGPDLQCARIRVPLDWDRPNGRTISLALIRHLASKPNERIGTLFINPGGPGDTGVGLVQGDPDGIDAFGDGRFDVVSWDPRGTHRQHPGALLPQTREARRASGRAPRSRSPRPPRSAIGASPPPWRGAAARSAAGSCPTSRPPTPPATSTTCAASSARRSSPTSASPTAPSSARPTPTCSPTGSGRC